MVSAKTRKMNTAIPKPQPKTKYKTTPSRRSMTSPTMTDLTKMKCDYWYVDRGVTQHITNRLDWFTECKPFMSPKSMDCAKNGVTL